MRVGRKRVKKLSKLRHSKPEILSLLCDSEKYNSEKQRTQYLVIFVPYLVRFHRTIFLQHLPRALHSDSSRSHVVTYPNTIFMLEKCFSLFLEKENI